MLNRAKTLSGDFSDAAATEVLDDLAAHCPAVSDEVAMLLATFEEARVRFLIRSSGAAAAAPSAAPVAASKAAASASAPASAAAAAAQASSDDDDGTGASNRVTTQQQQQNQKQQRPPPREPRDAQALADAALGIHIPLRTLEGDGASTLAHVQLTIILESPGKFPDGELSVRFKSAQLSPALRSDLSTSILAFATELQATGSLSVAALAARAEEMLLGLPVAVQSSTFGCCLSCNIARTKAKLPKVPQPIRVTFDDASNVDTAQCLMCKSELVVFIPSMVPTTKTECSYCCCDDHPLITLSCRCVSCFDCFVRFADIAVGSKQLKRPIFGFMGMGVRCPCHSDSVLTDPGLMKMLTARTMFRFNSFAVKTFALLFGGFVCANPACTSGVPQIPTSQRKGLARCIYCERATCLQCGLESTACACKTLERAVNFTADELMARIFRAECVKQPVACPVVHGDVMFVLGAAQHIVSVPLNQPTVWRAWTDAHVWQAEMVPRKLRTSTYMCVFNGAPLRPDWPLSAGGVFPGAVVYLLPVVTPDANEMAEEVELWNFRRQVASDGTVASSANSSAISFTKKCPKCTAPVAHYHGHGCHHIGVVPCCGHDWCFVCLGAHPCKKCPLFCNDTCGCPLCPECRPMAPCDICQGCPKCKVKAEFS